MQRHIEELTSERSRLAFLAAAAAEEERRRLAVGLHDETIQELGAALLWLDADTVGELDLKEAQGALLAATTSLRQISAGTLPSRVEGTGLASSLRDALEDLGDEHPEVCLRLSCTDPVAVDAATTGLPGRVLVRNALESVRNSLEHGSPSQVHVVLELSNRRLVVEVCDNGSGICDEALSTAERTGHLGVVSMRALTAALGGSVEITSTPWHQTRVRMEVPVGTVSTGAS